MLLFIFAVLATILYMGWNSIMGIVNVCELDGPEIEGR
jgi:hypothetical protein